MSPALTWDQAVGTMGWHKTALSPRPGVTPWLLLDKTSLVFFFVFLSTPLPPGNLLLGSRDKTSVPMCILTNSSELWISCNGICLGNKGTMVPNMAVATKNVFSSKLIRNTGGSIRSYSNSRSCLQHIRGSVSSVRNRNSNCALSLLFQLLKGIHGYTSERPFNRVAAIAITFSLSIEEQCDSFTKLTILLD